MSKPIRIGLCLSGGGAKGIAHIGVLKALHESSIYPDIVSGTSAGSIIGTLYAAGKTTEEMTEFVRDGSLFKIYKVILPSDGLTKLSYLKEKLAEVIPNDSFEELKRPLFVAITNLLSGESEIRSKGTLFDVIVASSSIPLVFSPVEIDGQLYVDGGVLANFPVKPLVKHADVIIGVNLMPHTPVQEKTVQNIIGIATRCFAIAIGSNTQPQLRHCDVLIEPANLEPYNLFQIHRYKELIEIGYEAAMDKIPEIIDAVAAARKSGKKKVKEGKVKG
ncbi:MAG: patatin-like phospholipase family protein [Saprospiraceae bacterium]|nr:patatin-like phospholipase family protein [Saprospiraceae bacterium]